MNYRIDPKNGNHLSILGYGCMRYTKKATGIDYEKAKKEMEYAYQNGVNYFDTAYVYAGCEEVLGRFLDELSIRDKVFIATKLPHYLVKKQEDFDRYFNEQCRRLRTDYIDYYLMHMLNDLDAFRRLQELGIDEWIQKKKESGQIRNIGFSFHGGKQEFIRILDGYNWDFCQIQYNYMDENAQASRGGLQYASSVKKLPVIIMEPLRGGRLVQLLPDKAKKIWQDASPKRSAAEWALRWIWNQEEPTVVLSGMNSMEQVTENVRTASDVKIGGLSEEELHLYEKVKESIAHSIKVGCTGCGYCVPCPKGVDIPNCFRAYNVRYTEGFVNGMREYLMMTSMKQNLSNASLCAKCGACEKKCPQQSPIRDELANVVKKMENPIYKIARRVVQTQKAYKKKK